MTDDEIRRAALLWRNNVNTQTIAKLLHLTEAEVANHIGKIKSWDYPTYAKAKP